MSTANGKDGYHGAKTACQALFRVSLQLLDRATSGSGVCSGYGNAKNAGVDYVQPVFTLNARSCSVISMDDLVIAATDLASHIKKVPRMSRDKSGAPTHSGFRNETAMKVAVRQPNRQRRPLFLRNLDFARVSRHANHRFLGAPLPQAVGYADVSDSIIVKRRTF